MQKTCIIVPCYNEELRLPANDFTAYIASHTDYFCFVNDGSTDATSAILEGMRQSFPETVMVLDMPRNSGKAEAVRYGLLQALKWQEFDLIGYFDADLATPLDEIEHLKSPFLLKPNCIMALGSRVRLLGRNIQRTAKRHYLGRVFSTVASLLLRLPVYDTQCGAKLLRAGVCAEIFAAPFISPWLFDIEVIARCINKYGPKATEHLLIEVPLRNWAEKSGSRIKLKHIVKLPFELLKIYTRYRPGLRARVVA